MKQVANRSFVNGTVYHLETDDGFPVEVTDTFLPFYTKDAVGRKQNALTDLDVASRSERWMIGVSCMSGCPVQCKFCATARLPRFRNLSAEEIVQQVEFVVEKNPDFAFGKAREHKINYTRMGEPFLNLAAVRQAIEIIDERYPGTHHYVSTIGIRGSDFSWIKDNITLQLSLHSLDEEKRDWLIPIKRKLTCQELGQVRTRSRLKTTLNMTLVDEDDFDIDRLKEHFSPKHFFVKLSPINPNAVSEDNELGTGYIDGINLI